MLPAANEFDATSYHFAEDFFITDQRMGFTMPVSNHISLALPGNNIYSLCKRLVFAYFFRSYLLSFPPKLIMHGKASNLSKTAGLFFLCCIGIRIIPSGLLT